MKKTLVSVLAVLFVFVSFGTFAEAAPVTTVCEDGVPICRTGLDPVDPTFKWVPPAEWPMYKTDRPQVITQTTGSGRLVTCALSAGNIFVESPDDGKQVIVMCKNAVVEGRLIGTEVPRNATTLLQAAQKITADTKIIGSMDLKISGDIEVNHTGSVDLNHQYASMDNHDGPNWVKRIVVGAVILGGGYLIYNKVRDKPGPPEVRTGPGKPYCTGTGCPPAGFNFSFGF